VRDWTGNNPIRIVLDSNNRLPQESHVFDNQLKTIILSKSKSSSCKENTIFEVIDFEQDLPQQILQTLHKHQIQSVIIEGGRQTLQTFIDANLWDEVRIFIGKGCFENGIKAPIIAQKNIEKNSIDTDQLIISRNYD
jgi:diaminohydroxyphosphoribosylaminopyrimidine deaminase/5-amino-6-(5-phosphoribosylamino)uracil reductase